METNRIEENSLSSFPFEKAAPLGIVPWIKEAREKAWAHFLKIGFPDSKSESWKYTSLDHLVKEHFFWGRPEAPETNVADLLKSLSFVSDQAELVVFVNGFFVRKFSTIGPLPQGVQLKTLFEANEVSIRGNFGRVMNDENRGFTALNTAYFTDGLFLSVPEGKVLTKPVHIIYLTTKGTPKCQTHVRNLFLLGQDSSATVIEHYLSEIDSSYFVGAVTEAALSRGSSLTHTKIQQESEKAYHFSTLAVKQAEGSQLSSRTYSFGGNLARHEVETVLTEKKAECLLEGLYLTKGKQHMDTRTYIDHLSPSCSSQETFKGVLDGESTAIFDGRILVRENAQKTDARQSNKNLQLSKETKVYSKPQLQIYADDVKCSHGSSTGQMDEEALFYFQSRGIGREEAKRTLVYAFAGEMVERVGNEYLQKPLKGMVRRWMGEEYK